MSDNTANSKMALASMPVAPLVQTVRVDVRNAREFRPEGKSVVFYSADAELATPGQRWATLRLKISSTTGPVPVGMHDVIVDGFDLKKGEGVGHVVA